MECPKCGSRMHWAEKSYQSWGEMPGHWHCIKCGEIVEPGGEKQKLLINETMASRETVEAIAETMQIVEEGMTMATKTCNKCTKEKDLSEFNRNATVVDGFDRTCRECMKAIAKQTRLRKKVAAFKERVTRESNPKPGYNKPPAGRKPPPPPAPPPVSEALYIDPTELRALIRGVGKKLLQEFARFLEERYK